jgi:hypothetical protein
VRYTNAPVLLLPKASSGSCLFSNFFKLIDPHTLNIFSFA